MACVGQTPSGLLEHALILAARIAMVAMASGKLLAKDVRYAGRIQPVDATHSLNISAGVWKPSVLRGLSFNCLAIALS